MTSSLARRSKIVERVSARVFCHLEDGGGNPVTVFSSHSPLSSNTQERLAKACDWESVMVHHRTSSKLNNNKPQLSFYMPSGEQVSFCAHAAMGAALEANNNKEEEDDSDQVSFAVTDLVNLDEEQEYHTTIYDGDIVALEMNAIYEQKPISQAPMLVRMLRDYCGLEARDLSSTPSDEDNVLMGGSRPILCHSSIARPKTLVPVRSMDHLQEKAVAPQSPDGFALSCKALDDTTGLYLYSKSQVEDGAWECRQFPKASGYPEDPATGIAAGALACHLSFHHELELPAYKFHQGTAMGKPSLIVVDELVLEKQKNEEDNDPTIQASFRLLGRVEIDSRDSIEVEDDEAEEV